MMVAVEGVNAFGDINVIAPSNPSAFMDAATSLPFQDSNATVRYQQVYRSSLFTNVPVDLVYITVLTFRRDEGQSGHSGWTITNMQVNLSITQRNPDNLSLDFAENVGAVEAVVFGPKQFEMDNLSTDNYPVPLDRPFSYAAAMGNLLVDIRMEGIEATPSLMDASNSTADEISRVWSTNANATFATELDTEGMVTLFRFSAIPELTIYTSYFGTPTNWLSVEWPTQPSVFRLQQSSNLGLGESWQDVLNASPPRYFIPVDKLGKTVFYRLSWPTGP